MTTNNNSNELHVIFGTGPVGFAVMEELVKRGKQVRMVNRSGKLADAPKAVEVVASDAYDPAKTRDLTKGASVVYQCAQPEYHEWPEKFPPLQASIVEGVTANDAKLVVVENLYMYGDPNGRPMTEDMPYNAHTRKGQTRKAMSESLMAAHKSGKIRVVIGRASDFYGPRYLTAADQTFYPALAGKQATGIGNIDVQHTFTYVPDFGKALVILGEHDEAYGQVWHVPNAPTVTQREFMTMMFAEIGTAPKIGSMGKLMMRIGGLFIPGARETVEMMYEFEKPFTVNHSKFVNAFGDHSTPIRDAMRESVAWFKAHPKQKGAH